MSTAVLERPIDTSTDQDDPIHLVCVLHSPDVSACGLDMSGEPWTTEDHPDEECCPVCVMIWNSGGCPECAENE